MDINELYNTIVEANKPFVTVKLQDGYIDVNIGRRQACYHLKVIKDSQNVEHFQLFENANKSFFVHNVKLLFDVFDHHINDWKDSKISSLKLWLKDLNCTDITFAEPATNETLLSALCNIPHKQNCWIKSIFGLNQYKHVLILYTPETENFSVSTRDDNDNFVMLGITTNTANVRSIIVQSLKVNFNFDVIFK